MNTTPQLGPHSTVGLAQSSNKMEVPLTSFVVTAGERISQRFLQEKEGRWVRTCRVCGAEKEPTIQNFILVRRYETHIILDRTCRDCRKSSIGVGSRVCSRCGKSLPATCEFFGENRGYLKHICRECLRPEGLKATKRWQKNHPQRAKITDAIANARWRARNGGWEFDELAVRSSLVDLPRNCACCNIEMGSEKVNGKSRWPSVDRVDPKKGYIRGNIKIICYRCNVLKSDGQIEEFEAIARYMRASTVV